MAFNEVEVLLTLETRSPAHAVEIATALADDGTRVEVVR